MRDEQFSGRYFLHLNIWTRYALIAGNLLKNLNVSTFMATVTFHKLAKIWCTFQFFALSLSLYIQQVELGNMYSELLQSCFETINSLQKVAISLNYYMARLKAIQSPKLKLYVYSVSFLTYFYKGHSILVSVILKH